MKDIAYSRLKQDKLGYEIMLRRDQQGSTFTSMAKEYKLSLAKTIKIYNKLKLAQARLYINHIAVIQGLVTAAPIEKEFYNAYKCYLELFYACGYLEKKYKDILTPYRGGEPGMPETFIKNLPPLKLKLNKKTLSRIVEMRESQKKPFITIGKELGITPVKAKCEYKSYYYKRVVEIIEALQDKAETPEEKEEIWNHYFNRNISLKKCYDILVKQFPS